jgi:hypothetical protein
MTKFSDLIVEYKNVLDPDKCREIILKFEDSPHKSSGQTADRSPTQTKVSTDLYISSYFEWQELDKYIFEVFNPYVKKYLNFIEESFNGGVKATNTQIMDSGYQIQRTRPGEYYRWHTDDEYAAIFDTITQPWNGDSDARSSGYQRRLFTYIFYLNDGFSGGRTQFKVGPTDDDIVSITPETGKLLCFPANVLYCHQGEEVTKGVKYLMTGWVSDFIRYPVFDSSPMSNTWRKEYIEQGRELLVAASSETGTEGAEMPLDASIIGS